MIYVGAIVLGGGFMKDELKLVTLDLEAKQLHLGRNTENLKVQYRLAENQVKVLLV